MSLSFAIVSLGASARVAAQSTVEDPGGDPPERRDRFAMAVHVGLGAGGRARYDARPMPVPGEAMVGELAPSLGLGARWVWLPSRFVAFGGFGEMTSFRSQADGFATVGSFGPWLAVRFPVAWSSGRQCVPFLGIPLGVSAGRYAVGDARADWWGWTVGAFAGVQVDATNVLALYGELGWQRHQVFDSRPNAIGVSRVDITTNQVVARFGIRVAIRTTR